MRHRTCGLILAAGLWLSLDHPPEVRGQADEARDREVTARFLSVLERSPRRGTALDRVYGDHVERGELDALIKTYQDRVAKDPKDGNAWMLLGLIESQRGRDSAAVAAFKAAEGCRADEALPSYYLGQALVLVGQPTAAAGAFERAVTRKASRNDLLEIYQALGRVYQRARRDEQALDVWNRLEKLFPDDPRVQEQIASALAEESKFEPALVRYEALAKSTRDPFRKVRFKTEAADLKVRLGRQEDALRDYEALLAGLDPESWLFREVRRKIEDVFTRNDDLAGLTKYYERWVAKSPEDVDSMSRLGKALASQGRAAEARDWFDRALKLAPSTRSLRLALIEQLANERKFAEAAAQFEALAKLEPNNPDIVKERGKMLLRDNAKPEADRKRAAAEVWRKLVEAKPDDPSTAAQVADFFRQGGMVDDAISLYKKAIELAPTSPQYREYLGEYYHTLKRPEDALATWRGIASGPDRSAASQARLGEILAGFGYKSEAIDAFFEACKLDPGSYPPRLRLTELLLGARRFDEAEVQLVAAEPLAENEERREEILTRRIELDEAAGRLAARLTTLSAEVAGPAANDPSAWRKLARYNEVSRKPSDAVSAAEKAVALDGKSPSTRATLARLYEAGGRFADAAEAYPALASLDRRNRTEHLTSVARLEARLGRKDEAFKAGRELLAAAPGNPENLQFYADLCFQLGDNEQGLETLRKAARANESDPRMLMNLADALAREFRTEEAIEISWKAFEKTKDLDARLGLIAKLADLHLRRNQFDRLTARLERLQTEDARRREATLFLAQAHATLGDYGTARRQLEGLLDGNARDTALLKQLSRLAEDEGDFAAATKFQQQLHDVAPDGEVARRLAELALKAGEIELAESIWARNTEDGQDLARVLSALNNLSTNGRFETVLTTTNRLLRADPNNWEVLYREGKALASLGRADEASARFRAILDLRRDDDELSAIVKATRKSSTLSPATDRLSNRLSSGYLTVKAVFGLSTGYPSSTVNGWSPGDFGLARMAALADPLARAHREGKQAEWLAARRRAAGARPADPRSAWDDLYVAMVVNDFPSIYETAKALIKTVGHEPSSDYAFLLSMVNRNRPTGLVAVRAIDDEGPDQTPPLPDDEVDMIRDAFRTLVKAHSSNLDITTLRGAMTELRRAGRLAEVEAEYRTLIDSAIDHQAIYLTGFVASERGDFDAIRKLSDAFYRLPPSSRTIQAGSTYIVTSQQRSWLSPAYYFASAMKVKADAKQHGEILRLLDDELALASSPARIADRAKTMRPAPFASPLSSSSSATLVRNVYPVFTSPSALSQNLDYPKPTLYLDGGSILVLRNAFAFFKRDDLLNDLVTHMKQVADAAPKDSAAERQARLASSAVFWWAEDRASSLKELARAVELTPGDVDLKLTMADLRVARREPEEALAIVDSIDAVDQDVTRRRELLALRLAVQTGKAERARQAAERLFGLRLDTTTQVQLAAQMNQLGMLDLADAVLARTQRQVGNNSEALLELMNQYRRQGNIDAAVQIALQFLRRATGLTTLRPTAIDDVTQRQAIEVLSASGKLKEMIERVEGQVKLSPQSLVLQQTLATYYRAAGQLDKLKATNEAILKLRPEDTNLRVQVANQLAQAGDFAGALEQYRLAFARDPSMFTYHSTTIHNIFRSANRLADVATLFEQVGLKNFSSPAVIVSLIGVLLRDPKTLDQGTSLMAQALEAFPNDRAYILNIAVGVEPFWSRSEVEELARKAVLPDEGASVVQWSGLNDAIPIGGYGLDGKLTMISLRLLDASARKGTLDELAKTIERAMATRPAWLGGKALLALVRIRQGRVEEGRRALETLLADASARPPFEVLMILGQEVREIPECQPLAIAIYERALKFDRAYAMGSLSIKASAMNQLAMLYRKAGRKAEALAVADRTEERLRTLTVAATSVSQIVEAYRRANSLSGLGSLFLELGDPADAIRLFDEVLSSTDDLHLARTYPIRDMYPSVDSMVQQDRHGLDQAFQVADKETLDSTLETLLKPKDAKKQVELLLVVNPREIDKALVRSLLASALEQAGREPATLARMKTRLDEAAKAQPGDFEVQIARALADCQGGDPGLIASAAAALDRLTDETPLASLAPGAQATTRQADEAARRLGLWLVARVCWNHDSTFEAGDRLASKALDAARRQADPHWALAMLRERGLKAIERGDRKGAETRWESLLALILEDRLAQPTPSPTRPARVRVPAVTVDRFRQAAEFSRLAASHGMADLSLRAIREPLKGGPPVLPTSLVGTNTAAAVRSLATIAESAPDPTLALVETMLVEIDALWIANKVAPEAAYETLRDVVLPPSRPTEIFLYDPTLNRLGRPSTTAGTVPQAGKSSVIARILARRAVLAGKVEDLRQRGAARQGSPAAGVAARLLLGAIEETPKGP
jgi:tetratricopeptide (TPR) repeat protein